MVFEHIEKLKSEYTDKYVIVDGERPELRRFKNLTGLVRTVNMSGRALVEFDAFDNIAWYDIDVDYLKVVPKPEPKVEEKKPAAKPAKAAPAKPAAAKAKPSSGAMSVEEIMAAARGGAGAAPAKAAAPAAEKPAAPAKKPGAMSIEEIMAAARGNKAGAAAQPEVAATVDDAAEVGEALEAARRPQAEAEPEPEAAAEPAAPVGDLPTDTDAIVAWCQQHDTP